VARANLLALEQPVSGPINIGTGVETDVNRLFGILARLAGFGAPAAHAPERSGEQRRSVIDPALAGRLLGWKPAVSLEAGLAETLAFFRQHP